MEYSTRSGMCRYRTTCSTATDPEFRPGAQNGTFSHRRRPIVRSESNIRVLEAELSPAGGGHLYAEFDTPWGPPYRILEDLCAKGFDVTCTYRETSMDFGGEWKNGSDNRYRCRYWKIPKNAGSIAQEICAAIILGRPVMLFRSGKPARLDPESCGVINGSEAVYGVFRGDPIAPDRGDWGLLELKHVDAAFTVHGTKSVAADGLPDGLPPPGVHRYVCDKRRIQ